MPAKKYSLSKEELRKELLKCGRDPIYFINTYCKVQHPTEGRIPFKTYKYQDELIKEFQDYRFNIILKARQLGISTIVAGYVSWLLLFHRDKSILVVATKFAVAGNIVKKVKKIIKSLPSIVKISDISVDNQTSFELKNGSWIKASSTSDDAGRSEALSLLVIDEAAHIDGLESMWTALAPTISTGGRCIALSSPAGVGNWFHKTYISAEEGKNKFNAIKLMWDVHPDRDQKWFEEETKNMSKRQIAQELCCNFNASGDTVFDSDDIKDVMSSLKEPRFRDGFDKNLWIWEEYIPGCEYIISGDVARGDGTDYSVFHIFRLDNMKIVGEYQGKPTPDMFSKLLNLTGREYGNALVIIENNSIGYSVLDKLEKELNYPNLYYTSNTSIQEYISANEAINTGAKLGFTTSMKTRPLVIAKMEEMVRNKKIIIFSNRLLNEMRTFVWNNGRPESMRSYNDDLIMACAIGCWVRDTILVVNTKELEYTKAFARSIFKTNTIFDSTIPGQRKDNIIHYKEREKKDLTYPINIFKG